jgi:hypothetical protein
VAKERKRWHDAYAVGQQVEVRVVYADGPRWVRARIDRKTLSGHPVASTTPAEGSRKLVIVVDRKINIRVGEVSP